MCVSRASTFAFSLRDLTLARQIAALGLEIVAREVVRFDSALCEEFYEHVRDSAYWEGIVEFITSGPIVAMALRGENAILRWREAMGPTWPPDACKTHPESIRARFGSDRCGANAVHGAKSVAEVERQLAFLRAHFAGFDDAALYM